jgi:hypothetical protein
VEGAVAGEEKPPRVKPAHLMCRNRFWGITGAIAGAYFAYGAYAHIRDANLLWPHNWWSLLTYSVWIVLMLGLLSETRCSRERIFFGLVLLSLLTGFVFLLWAAAPLRYAREAREAVLLLWIAAALASVTTLAQPKEAKG